MCVPVLLAQEWPPSVQRYSEPALALPATLAPAPPVLNAAANKLLPLLPALAAHCRKSVLHQTFAMLPSKLALPDPCMHTPSRTLSPRTMPGLCHSTTLAVAPHSAAVGTAHVWAPVPVCA